MRRISKIMTALQQRAGGNELPETEAGVRTSAAPSQLYRDIVSCLADFFNSLGKRQRQLVLGAPQIKHSLAQEQRHEVLRSINPPGQFARSGDGLIHFARRKAFYGSQCRS